MVWPFLQYSTESSLDSGRCADTANTIMQWIIIINIIGPSIQFGNLIIIKYLILPRWVAARTLISQWTSMDSVWLDFLSQLFISASMGLHEYMTCFTWSGCEFVNHDRDDDDEQRRQYMYSPYPPTIVDWNRLQPKKFMIRRRLIATKFVYSILLRLASQSIYALSCRCQTEAERTIARWPFAANECKTIALLRFRSKSVIFSWWTIVAPTSTVNTHTHHVRRKPNFINIVKWIDSFFLLFIFAAFRDFALLMPDQCIRVGRLQVCGCAASTTTSSIAFLYVNFYVFLRDPSEREPQNIRKPIFRSTHRVADLPSLLSMYK